MAGTNSFLQFAANSSDILSDADYQNSAVRVNGVSTGIAVSTLHNKMYLQWSTIAYSIGQLVANQNLNASDADPATLVANLQNAILSLVNTSFNGSVFIARNGSTTHSEVATALAANKVVLALSSNRVYTYAAIIGGTYIFTSSYIVQIPGVINDLSLDSLWLANNDNWSTQSVTLAPIDSPAFTGNPTAATQTAGDSSTKLATTAFVQNEFDEHITISGTKLVIS